MWRRHRLTAAARAALPQPGESVLDRHCTQVTLPRMPATYSEDRETPANAPAAPAAQLGDKLPARPKSTAELVRASLILCPAR